jgi:hypothetical protein
MLRSKNPFAVLAERAEMGDSSAQFELRQKLEPEMIRIVRRVIRQGNPQTAAHRRILAEARRVGLDAAVAASVDGERLIRKVACSVSVLFVDGLRSKAGPRLRIEETFCNGSSSSY